MSKRLYFLLIFLCACIASFAQTTLIDDDLQGSTDGTKVGGSFSSEGYKPGLGSGHILYEPSQVVNGYVEFQIKGFSASLVPSGADNGFVGLYDGRGISEPIQYSDEFKENFFRWNFHWREDKDAFKGVISCADPTSARLNAATAVYTLANSPEDPDWPGQPERDWSSEPTGNGYSFNSNNWYTIKIEWNNKSFKAFVNGTQVWSTSGPNDYAPVDFKIWLGSAPGSGDKYTNSVQNIVYRNFKLVSYGGTPPGGTPPSAPSSLDADPAGDSQINLSWTDNANDEDGFKIERKTGSGGSWSQISTVGDNTTSYQNTGLSSNTTYYYRVRAYNSDGNSSYSNEANATTSSGGSAPSAPSSLDADPAGDSQINLSWTDNANDEDGFKIERKTGSGGSWSQISTVGDNTTSYQNTGLSSNTTYYYRVRAYNSSGNSDYSNEADATTNGSTPADPSNLALNVISGTQINLSWTDNANDEDGFKIERKTGSGGSWSQISTAGDNTTSYQNTGLVPNTTYYYRVRAFNSSGNSNYSNEESATTDASVPAAPSGLTAVTISSTEIDLSWTDNSDNEDGFYIYRELPNDSVDAVATLGAGVTEYKDTNLTPNTEYYYRVKSFNSSGTSENSNIDSATTNKTVPLTPLNLTASPMNSTHISLSWTDNSHNEDGFKIERKSGVSSNWVQIATVGSNNTAHQDTGLASNSTYYYRIASYNSAGNSNYSNEASATITGIEDLGFSAGDVKSYELYNNYPNPFNPSTVIQFNIPEESVNSLKIYDVTGKEADKILENEILPAGIYKYKFNSQNLPSGIYFYVLLSTSNISNKNFKSVKKMILLK